MKIHECDDWHDGWCSECCRDAGPCQGCIEAKVEREASRAQAMAEAVIKSAIEEISFKLATVSTPALVYLIENTMDDILWFTIDEILTARKVEGYC